MAKDKVKKAKVELTPEQKKAKHEEAKAKKLSERQAAVFQVLKAHFPKQEDDKLKKVMTDISQKVLESSSGGVGALFNEMFGDEPKTGQRVSVIDVFLKTSKGPKEVLSKAKKWATHGLIVTMVEDPKKPGDIQAATYLLTIGEPVKADKDKDIAKSNLKAAQAHNAEADDEDEDEAEDEDEDGDEYEEDEYEEDEDEEEEE